MLTFEEILEQVSELPLDRQELLIEIIQRRMSDRRRQVLAADSHAALEEFKTSQLKPLSAQEAIAELRSQVSQSVSCLIHKVVSRRLKQNNNFIYLDPIPYPQPIIRFNGFYILDRELILWLFG
jgi:hypothetical protein